MAWRGRRSISSSPSAPNVTSLEWLKAGNCHWGWDPRQPSYIGVLPRDGEAKEVRWFKGKARAMVYIRFR